MKCCWFMLERHKMLLVLVYIHPSTYLCLHFVRTWLTQSATPLIPQGKELAKVEVVPLMMNGVVAGAHNQPVLGYTYAVVDVE
mmetsp:Transcript_9780/g.16043  ORF Transcript_9780/g.16043 Transcript_9780/m.16043 type:complete len:83 (+) Transcript_9780:309-557(+)